MNILLVAYPFATVGPDAVGGAEQVVSTLDHALVRAGHRSFVVACAGSVTAGVLLAHELPPGEIDTAARASTHTALCGNIAHALRRHAIDLVHLHGVHYTDHLPPPGPPCLATLHLSPDWYCPAALAPTRPDTWIQCVSAFQHRICPPSPRLLPPIPNGVPLGALGSARHARRGFTLMLGRICPEKAPHLALAAAHAAGIPLLIGGAVSPYATHRSYFDTAVAPLLDANRRWLGPVAFARKRRLLSAARCVLIPSLAAETASLVAMEAAACGTPVIAFPAGALAETVEHGRTGFLVRDAAEMAAAIGRVHEIDPEACRQIARDRFSDQAMIAATLARYAELARPLAA